MITLIQDLIVDSGYTDPKTIVMKFQNISYLGVTFNNTVESSTDNKPIDLSSSPCSLCHLHTAKRAKYHHCLPMTKMGSNDARYVV